MKKRLLLVILVAISMRGPAHSRPAAKPSLGSFLRQDSILSLVSAKGYVPMLFHNFGLQATSPFRLKPRDLLWLGGVAATTFLLVRADYEIDEEIRYAKNKSGFVRATSPVITEFGNTYGIGLTGILGLTGLLTRDRKLFQTSLLATQAAITSGVWVRLVKYCTSRERPSASYTDWANKGHPGGYWYGFFRQYDESVTSIGRDITFFDAFPSGHTSTAFAIATVFAMEYKEIRFVPILAYSLAGLAGITRMTEHTHWASDVFVGAWAGFLCAKQVVRYHQKLFSKGAISSTLRKRKAEFLVSPADRFAGIKLKMVY